MGIENKYYGWIVCRCRLCNNLIAIRDDIGNVVSSKNDPQWFAKYKNLNLGSLDNRPIPIYEELHKHCLKPYGFVQSFCDVAMFPTVSSYEDKPNLDFVDTIITVKFRDKISKDIREVTINEEDYEALCNDKLEGYYPDTDGIEIL